MLTDIQTVKAMLGETGTNLDAQFNALLPAADAAVKHYCQRDFEEQTYTLYLTGNNTQRVTVPQRPVQSVTSLFVNDGGYFGQNPNYPFDASTQLFEGVDWVLDRDQPNGHSLSGILFRIGTVWPILWQLNMLNQLTPYQGPCFGNIKVIYTAGFAVIPSDLQYAVALLVRFMQRTQKYGGYLAQSEKLGDYAYSLLVDPQHQFQVGTVLEILGRYREVGW